MKKLKDLVATKETLAQLYATLDDAIYDKFGERVVLEDTDRGQVEIDILFEIDDEI